MTPPFFPKPLPRTPLRSLPRRWSSATATETETAANELSPPRPSSSSPSTSSKLPSSSTTTSPSFFSALSRLSHASHPPVAGSGESAARALSHALAVVSRIPVSSRKYELVRSMAEHLLDDNLRLAGDSGGAELNRAALSGAFARTLRRLESAAAEASATTADRRVGRVVGAVRSRVRRWLSAMVEGSEDDELGDVAAEKLAAELLWLAQKMAEFDSAAEAVALWAMADRLGNCALAVEPSLQVALVRIAVFLFKHANSKQFEECTGGEEEDSIIADQRMAMLKSWLPFLCRASNGTDTPVLSSKERAEMVMVLEQLIQKLSWKQQEEVLAIWLHHFAACPDSDWPNLESCYTRWFSETRKLLM